MEPCMAEKVSAHQLESPWAKEVSESKTSSVGGIVAWAIPFIMLGPWSTTTRYQPLTRHTLNPPSMPPAATPGRSVSRSKWLISWSANMPCLMIHHDLLEYLIHVITDDLRGKYKCRN